MCVLSVSLSLAFLLQLLNAIQLFGANLDDYLHLLLPPIVKLFDAPDVPLQARKSVTHAVKADPHILPPVNHEITLDGEAFFFFPPCVFCLRNKNN